MTTVNDLIERTLRTYLYPPDYEPAMVRLQANITNAATTMTLGEFAIPEDEALIRIATLVELGQELVRITDYDATTNIATMDRAQRGTTAVAHTAADWMIIAPTFPRSVIFELMRDNITRLAPRLYTVSQDYLVTVSQRIAPVEDDLAISVIEIWREDWSDDTNYHGRIVDYHPTVGGRALITNLGMGTMWVRYRRRMGVATAETDDLQDDLGVDPTWETIVMLGTVGDMFAGRDVPKSVTDWVGSVLEAESIPVGTRSQLAGAIASYRQLLLDEAAKEMDTEYGITTEMTNPFSQRTRGGFG